MAVTLITQKPLYDNLPVGSEIIFTVSNDTAVANETKVKFCVDVHISDFAPPNPNTTTYLIGTFKTTPNDTGVGMFDLSSLVESYVKSDNIAHFSSLYKGAVVPTYFPIHLLDGFSMSQNSCRWLVLRFYVEYADATTGIVEADTTTEVDSDRFVVFNGYLKSTDIINITNAVFAGVNFGDFGFDLARYYPVAVVGASTKRYLTNAPQTQYANSGDYGTLAYFSASSTSAQDVRNMVITYYDDAGTISSADTVANTMFTGGNLPFSSAIDKRITFFGCFPANLENWSANYAAAVTAGLTYYTISAQDASGDRSIRTMTIRLNCPDLKNFEPIRLAWLNQFGAWDYYTFTKKSIRTTSTQGTTYTQLAGTWNDSRYKLRSYRGGKKSFRVNATEKIRVNTDFVSEDFNVMFEELINSPEVYLLDNFQTDGGFSSLNNYVTPVRITTSNFTTKTSANDNLIQYTFEIEKSKTLRTQSV
tara:strand:+ start:288 stop:1715 length:1428 start_codon:yes stop_codon:yes gene_type:complete